MIKLKATLQRSPLRSLWTQTSSSSPGNGDYLTQQKAVFRNVRLSPVKMLSPLLYPNREFDEIPFATVFQRIRCGPSSAAQDEQGSFGANDIAKLVRRRMVF